MLKILLTLMRMLLDIELIGKFFVTLSLSLSLSLSHGLFFTLSYFLGN